MAEWRQRALEADAAARGGAARLQRELTLISAPAGFGKTTLLSKWGAVRAVIVGVVDGVTQSA